MIRRLTHWLIGVHLALSTTAAFAAKPPEVPVPPDARVNSISEKAEIFGLQMQVRHFQTKLKLEKLFDFYRKEWGDGTKQRPGYILNDALRPWLLISRLEDDYLMTVQAQPAADGGSWGFLGMSRVPDKIEPPELGKDFPRPRGTSVMHEIKTEDPGQKGRTMMLANESGLGTNVDFYRNLYEDEGYAFDMDKSVGQLMHVLAMRRGRKRVNIVVTAVNKQTRVVVNEVTHDLL